MRQTLVLAVIACLLSACATPEYRAAREACSESAYQQFPVQKVPTLVTRTMAVQVPTGRSHCVTTQQGNVTNTSCQQIMRTDFLPYQESVLVDLNENPRETMLRQCAAQMCSLRYGNRACKTN